MINKYKYFVYLILFSLYSALQAQSIQDMQKMKSQYEDLLKKQNSLKNSSFEDSILENEELDEYRPKEVELYRLKIDSDIDDLKTKYFGYNFFTYRDTISFWENLPAPSNYLLGSGDEIIISLWGETQLRQKYIISKDGKIYDEKVGLLNLSGLSILDAQSFLKIQFGRVYSTLNGSNPTTYFNTTLGDLKLINVNFVGHVKYPGVYPIHPFSTLITGLIQAGGVDTLGSLRKIKLKRFNEDDTSLDFYSFLLKGEFSSSFQLRDQDVVVIPPRVSTVTIDSSILRPGIYESLPNETIFDIIEFAGGLSFDASNKLSIRRLIPFSERINGNVYDSKYIDYSNAKLVTVNSGDKIIVPRLFDEIHHVEIIGQVKTPGLYNYYDGMTLLELINLSGGLNDTTFVKSIYLEKAEIIRRNPYTRYEEVIEVSLNDLIADKSKDVPLQNLDRVVMRANLNFFEKENIIIEGEVNIPGSYPLVLDNESLRSIINRAGGLTSKALSNGISIYRNQKYFNIDQAQKINTGSETLDNKIKSKVRVGWQNKEILLMPGDSLFVREKTSTIFINGEVYNPGILEYKEGKNLRYYINLAGGVSQKGNKNNITIQYPNGVISPKKWYSSPKVYEGSIITVNPKIISEPFNITQFATNWTSILSSMVTAIVLSQQL